MGVTGASGTSSTILAEPILFTVYCNGQTCAGKADELRQLEAFLQKQVVKRLALAVVSSIGATLPWHS